MTLFHIGTGTNYLLHLLTCHTFFSGDADAEVTILKTANFSCHYVNEEVLPSSPVVAMVGH